MMGRDWVEKWGWLWCNCRSMLVSGVSCDVRRSPTVSREGESDVVEVGG